jgi:ABC-type branched-subunit amino acid transport system ATPase component
MIELKGVCKSFGRLQVLKDMYLKVREDEKSVIIGLQGGSPVIWTIHSGSVTLWTEAALSGMLTPLFVPHTIEVWH